MELRDQASLLDFESLEPTERSDGPEVMVGTVALVLPQEVVLEIDSWCLVPSSSFTIKHSVAENSRRLWSAANGGLRDGGLSKSEDIWGKRAFFLRFLNFPGALRTLRKRAKKAEKGEKGQFRPISRKSGQAPLKPPFVTPPFAAAQEKALAVQN